MDIYDKAVELHRSNKGKLEVVSKVKVSSMDDMALAYTPGVARPCTLIKEDEDKAYELTGKGNSIAVVTDGSAVLGQDTEEIIKAVKYIAPGFGGINLEDISAPRCFEIEERLKAELDIPVFHDDQHGTAIAVSAGLINALKLVKKNMSEVKVVINGAGSAGISICKLLLQLDVKNITMVDRLGIVCTGESWMNNAQEEIAKVTNLDKMHGTLVDAIKGSDVFIGVSAANVLTPEMVKTMNNDAIIFAMANPQPEIEPSLALEAGARVVATGRSDYPNQINNVLVFPGIFRGALDGRVDNITEEMKIACAKAIANIIPEDQLKEDYIIPDAFDKRVVPAVRKAVIEAK